MASPAPVETAPLRAVAALSELFQNGDSAAHKAALEAFRQGREAYWSKAGYSNQRAGRLLLSANCAGLAYALLVSADDTSGTYAARTPYLLASLIPLNAAAMMAIECAWAGCDEAAHAAA